MSNSYHILNGDALQSQFPEQISGEQIIARVCLIDGDITGDSLEELYQTRAQFIAQHYNGFSEADYYAKTVSEFEKIKLIPTNSNINLWFEEDLFCQVNLWFIFHLLKAYKMEASISIVLPFPESKYGFGSMSKVALEVAYLQKINISPAEVVLFQKLWPLYQSNQTSEMLIIAEQLTDNHPYLTPAIQAHIDRLPNDNSLGRPIASLIKIMNELQTESFGPIFQLFSEREAIYGFGDLQVKRMLDHIIAGQ